MVRSQQGHSSWSVRKRRHHLGDELSYTPIRGAGWSGDDTKLRSYISDSTAWLESILARTEQIPEPVADKSSALASGQANGDSGTWDYVNPVRINQLRAINSQDFDLVRLVRLCEELNVCSRKECYLAIAMLTRTILHHVPPIFSCQSFTEVANSRTRSMKAEMGQLDHSLKNIADQHLHIQIRRKEVLPPRTQVDLSADLDVLLGEVVRLLSEKQNAASV